MPVLLRRFRRLNNTMLGALDSVVGPAREQVGGVDDDGVFDGGRIDEGVVGGEDLQAAGHVLEEEGDGAVVGVGACADAALVLLEFACWAGRVVEESGIGGQRLHPRQHKSARLTSACYLPYRNTNQTKSPRSPNPLQWPS